MGISNSQDKNVFNASTQWNLRKLYSDLERVNRKSLTKSSRKYIEGILLGYSPSKIADEYCHQNKQKSGTVRTIISREIYPSIRLLLNLPDEYQLRWNRIPDLLAQYKKENSIDIQNLSILSLNKSSIEKNVSQVSVAIINSLLSKYFKKGGFSEDFLSHNMTSMSFRNDWQHVVNKLVSETKECLRAMVLATELQSWWSSLPGDTYMATNIDLVKRGVDIKRIFLIDTLDVAVRSNALQTAYLHKKVGIDVRVLESVECKLKMFQGADMLSIHDRDFIALYYLSTEKETTEIVKGGSSIYTLISFYDELFDDDIVCNQIEEVLPFDSLSRSFFSNIDKQIDFYKKVNCSTSIQDFLAILPSEIA